jgi:hypothetical protein
VGVLPYDAEERLDRLERQVRYLLRHAGLDPEVAAADDGLTAAGPQSGWGAEPQTGWAAGPQPGWAAGPPTGQAPPELAALVQNGKLIEAIKLYRQMTGVGLKEAKDAVDALRTDIPPAKRRSSW